MMADKPIFQVKEGREYVLGGKLYTAGQPVPDVPLKYEWVLTGPKGALERITAAGRTSVAEVAEPPKVAKPVKEIPTPATKVEDIFETEPATEELVETETVTAPSTLLSSKEIASEDEGETETEGKSLSGRGEYQRRDLTADSRTGPAKQSSSLRPAPVPKTPTSAGSKGKRK